MMREVTGAFCGSRKLDEALADLRAEGITGDRVRVAEMSGFNDFHACLARSTGAPTQWITAEFGSYDELQSEIETQVEDYSVGFDASDDDILPSLEREHGDEDLHSLTRVMVSIRDEAEMRAVCDIFSRLGTDDVDVEGTTV